MRFLKNLLLWLPAALWYRLIWGFSAQTAAVSGGASDGLLERLLSLLSPAYLAADGDVGYTAVELLSFFIRKGAHMFLYFVLAALVWLALSSLPLRRAGRAAALVPLCAALAALDEYHQTLVPGRSGELRDILVDLTGVLVFLALTALPFLAQWLKKRPRLIWLAWLLPAMALCLLLTAALADPIPFFNRFAPMPDSFLPLNAAERAAMLSAAAPILRQTIYPAASALLGFCAVCPFALTGSRKALAALPASLPAVCVLSRGLPLLPALCLWACGDLAGLAVWAAFPLPRR